MIFIRGFGLGGVYFTANTVRKRRWSAIVLTSKRTQERRAAEAQKRKRGANGSARKLSLTDHESAELTRI